MRLTSPLVPHGPVKEIRLRIRVSGLPAGAVVDVTDVQLQAGGISGFTLRLGDLGLAKGQRRYVNGVVNGGMDVVVLANPDRASGSRWQVTGDGDMTVGAVRFGTVSGSVSADGETGVVDQGHGQVPVITERSDLAVQVDVDGRAHVRADFRVMEAL